jgi:hypothetical protein
MKTILLIALAGLACATTAQAQVSCYRLGNYTTCNGPDNHSTTITELSPGKGVITTDRDMQPYTLFPSVQPDRQRSSGYAIDSLEPLDRLDRLDSILNDDLLLLPLFPAGLD